MKWIICSEYRDLLYKALRSRSSSSVFAYPYNKGIVFGVLYIEGCSIVEMVKNEEWVVASIGTKQFLRASGVDVKEVKHNEIVDLSVNGDRWEGDVLNGKPCGWGILYDKENHVEYEGFRIGKRMVCYGRKYYADISKIEYEGEWFEGMRCGRGTQYNRNGDVVYDGEWLFDKPLETTLVLSAGKKWLHNRVEELIVNDNCGNEKGCHELYLMYLPRLRKLRVGDHCFKNVKWMEVVKLRDLESVVIGRNSFTSGEQGPLGSVYHFWLKSCPKLRELRVGDDAFAHCDECLIEGVGLEVVEMGSNAFLNTPSLELKSVLIHSK